MNNHPRHRRFPMPPTLAAISLLAIATLTLISHAGPLTPAAGPVTSTGRTLTEVYDKIPANTDGRTPIVATGNINTPGSYVLTANLSGASPLTINANNVTLDLNGFTVTCTDSNVPAITISTARANIILRNGFVVGGSTGISAVSVQNVLVQDMVLLNQRFSGMNFASSATRGCRISRCQVNDVGGSSLPSDSFLTVQGIVVGGSMCRVEDCTVARMVYNGLGPPTFQAIAMTGGVAGAVNVVARCTAVSNATLNGNGVIFTGAGTGVYRENTVVNFSTPYSPGGATNGGGNN